MNIIFGQSNSQEDKEMALFIGGPEFIQLLSSLNELDTSKMNSTTRVLKNNMNAYYETRNEKGSKHKNSEHYGP